MKGRHISPPRLWLYSKHCSMSKENPLRLSAFVRCSPKPKMASPVEDMNERPGNTIIIVKVVETLWKWQYISSMPKVCKWGGRLIVTPLLWLNLYSNRRLGERTALAPKNKRDTSFFFFFHFVHLNIDPLSGVHRDMLKSISCQSRSVESVD